jgi:translation initiation factor 1
MGLVYSTDTGRMCPDCGQSITNCACANARSGAKNSGMVRVGRETKGRKGKGVTVISGLPLSDGEMQTLASRLKRQCGSGGTVKDGVIEIQGDHRDRLVEELIKLGYPAKRSGG